MAKVLNKRIDKILLGTVYVGRPSKWGNPFLLTDPLLPCGLSRFGKHRMVVDEYRRYIRKVPELMAALPELRGKDLVCWCHTWDGQGENPMYCHADILLELANQPSDMKE